MSRNGSIDLDFADGRHCFRLAWGELEQLQEACDAGPYIVLNRLLSGAWRVREISETLRLGLIGGGMAPPQAAKMVRDYVMARPPVENLVIAQMALGAAVIGATDEAVGKNGAAANQTGN